MQGELFADTEREHFRSLLRELAQSVEDYDTSKRGLKLNDVVKLAQAALKALEDSPMPNAAFSEGSNDGLTGRTPAQEGASHD